MKQTPAIVFFILLSASGLFAQENPSATPPTAKPAPAPQEQEYKVSAYPLKEEDVKSYFAAKHEFFKIAGLPDNVSIDISQFRYIDSYKGMLEEVFYRHGMDDLTFGIIFADIDAAFFDYAYVVLENADKISDLKIDLRKLLEKQDKQGTGSARREEIGAKIQAVTSEINGLVAAQKTEQYQTVLRNFSFIKKYAYPSEIPEFVRTDSTKAQGTPPALKAQRATAEGDFAAEIGQESVIIDSTANQIKSENEQEWLQKYKVHQRMPQESE